MNYIQKTVVFTISFLTLALCFGQLSEIRCDLETPASPDIIQKAYTCLTTVYNLDFNHYTVTLGENYTLPSGSNETSVCQGVDYFLNAPDSKLTAVFVFQDGFLYQFALRPINGPIDASRQYPNMTAAATDFLTRYQTISDVDLTPLLRLLGSLNQSNTTSAAVGNLSLNMDNGTIFPGHYVTTFTWRYTSDDACMNLIFDNGAFYTFMNAPKFTSQDSVQAMTAIAELSTALPSPSNSPSLTPSPTLSPSAVMSQQNQNTQLDQKTPTDNSTEYTIIFGLSIVIAVCVTAILFMKKKSGSSLGFHSSPNRRI